MSEDIKSRYQYVTQSDQAWTAIAIKDGKFNGVIYKYSSMIYWTHTD
jgi:hypothetical protein